MSESLPEHLDPWRAAKGGLSFVGRVALSDLPRVVAAVVDSEGESGPSSVSYRLDFGRDEAGRFLVSGQIRAQLKLVCQRCMGNLLVDVEVAPRVALAPNDHVANALGDELDVLVVEDDSMRLLDFIEDELLLSIPIVPRHAPGACLPPGHPVDEDAASGVGEKASEAEASDGRDEHPFAVLAALKRESEKLN